MYDSLKSHGLLKLHSGYIVFYPALSMDIHLAVWEMHKQHLTLMTNLFSGKEWKLKQAAEINLRAVGGTGP